MPIDVVCALEPTALGRELKRRLGPANVTLVGSGREIGKALRAHAPEMVIAGTHLLPTPIEDWVREVCARPESPDVVLVHDREDSQFRAAAIRAGCLAVLGSALPIDELTETIQALVQRRFDSVRRAVHATSPLRESRLRDFVSLSPRMQEFVALARKVVDTDSSLLLLGETGTGKERLARAVHEEGPRSKGPFVAVNCGAFPESLLESELFGHEKGAFTGASRVRKGYFEQADGGTLFLDEIGEVPLHLQVRLLRVLEDRRVQRLGAEHSFAVDIRMVAATNRDLEQEVASGRLRRDLYYRLAVVTLTLPPLRERVEDVAALFSSYVEHFRVALNRPIYGVQPSALEALVRYQWPGNVRELINVVERAVLLSPGPEIRLIDLPRAISSQAPVALRFDAPEDSGTTGAPPPWAAKPLHEAKRDVVIEFERAYLAHLLRESGGRMGATARRAGINVRSLYDLMQRHGLRKEDFKPARLRG